MSLSSPFGRYCLEEKIATGGMAEIFRAKLLGVEGFEKRVAIKRILPYWSERRDFISMLVDEAKVLVHLNHPNIVQVYELGRVGPIYFIAMEYVEGRDLRYLAQRLQASGRDFPQEMAVTILVDALKGLHYAHERTLYDKGFLEIVHRDISPQNILLSLEGEVKVSDFGIAKAVTQTHETQTGVLKGKYAYMSPEQALGRALDRRSDLFSMGIVLYEMTVGGRLFVGANDLETLERVRKAEIPWPQARTAQLLPGLREVMARALARERSERFQSAEAFAEALEACLPQGRRIATGALAKFFQSALGEGLESSPAAGVSPPFQTKVRQTLVVPDEESDTVSLVEAPRELVVTAVSQSSPPKKLPWILGLIWLTMALGLAWWLIPQFRRGAEAPVSAPGMSPPVAAPTVTTMDTSVEVTPNEVPKLKVAPDQADVKKVVPPQKKIAQFGSLRINAIPWGRVTIAGLVGGQETPVVQSNIKAGVYSVVVSNPSVGKTVSAQVNVRPDATTVCTADFEGSARIRCR
jgi:serine/threonine protein kinase